VDCDVLQADGGTRTASITGSYIALALAMQRLVDAGKYSALPLDCSVAATSVGVVGGNAMLDLRYEEDSTADVDFNIVKTSRGDYVEVQGTAEGAPFSRDEMTAMLDHADTGIARLFEIQEEILAGARNGNGA